MAIRYYSFVANRHQHNGGKMSTDKPMSVTTLRMPRDLLAYFKHRAIDNHRSFNSEILACLESIQAKENAPETAISDALVQ